MCADTSRFRLSATRSSSPPVKKTGRAISTRVRQRRRCFFDDARRSIAHSSFAAVIVYEKKAKRQRRRFENFVPIAETRCREPTRRSHAHTHTRARIRVPRSLGVLTQNLVSPVHPIARARASHLFFDVESFRFANATDRREDTDAFFSLFSFSLVSLSSSLRISNGFLAAQLFNAGASIVM